MADDYNSPFGGFGNSPFGNNGGFQNPAPQQPSFNAPQPEPAYNNGFNEPAPEPAAPEEVEEPVTAEAEPEAEEKPVEKPKPKKSNSSNRKKPSSGGAAGAISRDVVDKVLAINDALSAIDDRTLGLLKALAGIHPASAKNNVIAQLVSPQVKILIGKNVDTELDIVSKLDDPFAIALAFASLSREERKEHWNILLSCEEEDAKDIAGNDNGVFPSSWKDIQKESIGLNKLYTRTRDDYTQRLNDVKAVLDELK